MVYTIFSHANHYPSVGAIKFIGWRWRMTHGVQTVWCLHANPEEARNAIVLPEVYQSLCQMLVWASFKKCWSDPPGYIQGQRPWSVLYPLYQSAFSANKFMLIDSVLCFVHASALIGLLFCLAEALLITPMFFRISFLIWNPIMLILFYSQA